MKLHCNPLNTYTLYFNILFYIALIVGNKQFFQGVAAHVIPYFIVTEFMIWIARLYYACGRPLWKSILIDVLAHWLMLGICLGVIATDNVEIGKYTIYGFISPFILFILYLFIIKFNMRIYNDIDMRPYLLAYILLLAIVTIIWYFVD